MFSWLPRLLASEITNMAPPGDLEEDGEKSSLLTLADSSRRAGQKIGYNIYNCIYLYMFIVYNI